MNEPSVGRRVGRKTLVRTDYQESYNSFGSLDRANNSSRHRWIVEYGVVAHRGDPCAARPGQQIADEAGNHLTLAIGKTEPEMIQPQERRKMRGIKRNGA